MAAGAAAESAGAVVAVLPLLHADDEQREHRDRDDGAARRVANDPHCVSSCVLPWKGGSQIR